MIATFDIGGTSIKYGVLDEEEKSITFLIQNEMCTDAKQLHGQGVLKKVLCEIKELQKTYDITGIAISTAGMVDADLGVIVYANDNIPNYTGCNLKKYFEEATGILCWVENDVNAAALGEAIYGAGIAAKSVFMLTIGTGIGGAVVFNQEIYRGFSKSAGEIGYMWMGQENFENMASTTSLVKKVSEATNEEDLNGKVIFERAKKHDVICTKYIHEMCDAIAKGISNCVYLMNPQMIVLGGGIMTQEVILAPMIDTCLKKYLKENIYKNTKIEFAKLGNTAGMIGAYAYFMQKRDEKNA